MRTSSEDNFILVRGSEGPGLIGILSEDSMGTYLQST